MECSLGIAAHHVDSPVKVDGGVGLCMDANDVSACLHEVSNALLRLHNHLRPARCWQAQPSQFKTTSRYLYSTMPYDVQLVRSLGLRLRLKLEASICYILVNNDSRRYH